MYDPILRVNTIRNVCDDSPILHAFVVSEQCTIGWSNEDPDFAPFVISE